MAGVAFALVSDFGDILGGHGGGKWKFHLPAVTTTETVKKTQKSGKRSISKDAKRVAAERRTLADCRGRMAETRAPRRLAWPIWPSHPTAPSVRVRPGLIFQ